MHETLLVGSELAAGDGRIARGKCPVELNVISSDRVIGVIQNRVEIFSGAAHLARRRIGQIVRVAEGAVVDGVFQSFDGLATEDIVQRAVLHLKDDNILDLVLEIGDGSRGMRPGVALGGSRGDCGCEGQETKESTEIHFESREALFFQSRRGV